jgi:hypothetical protein
VPLRPTPPSRKRSVPNEGYGDSIEGVGSALAIARGTAVGYNAYPGWGFRGAGRPLP